MRLKAADGVELVGIYCEPPDRRPSDVLIHVHGYAGTFYENRFVSEMGDALASAGVVLPMSALPVARQALRSGVRTPSRARVGPSGCFRWPRRPWPGS